MSAAETLAAAQAAGVRFGIDGMDLLIEADCAPPPELIDGDLKRTEAMLTAQAHTLDAIFHNLARRAIDRTDDRRR